ncbi:MAG: hypothetical protein M3Z02_02475 [Actinomycetota bacterium]|nr:hypothetical protein [Actinomycetota bacterium]
MSSRTPPRRRPAARALTLSALIGALLLVAGCGSSSRRDATAPYAGQGAVVPSVAPPAAGDLRNGSALSGRNSGPSRQDPHLTPGSTTSGLDAAKICSRPASPGEVPEPVRAGVFAMYGIAYPAMAPSYSIDHLVPVGLGGDDTPRNLWPQPDEGGAGYPSKTRLGDRLHELVCSGQLPLKDAQQAISRDWYAAAQQYGVAVLATASATPAGTAAPVQVAVEPDAPSAQATRQPTAATPTYRARPVVRLGAPCTTPGAHAQTATGAPVTCKRGATDPAYRWHGE